MLQQGYPVGYLFAAIAFFLVEPIAGWRGLFICAAIPALLALFIRMRVEESQAWEATREHQKQTRVSFRQVLLNPVIARRFVYLVLLMAAFNFMSHGSQDYSRRSWRTRSAPATRDRARGHHLQHRRDPRRRVLRRALAGLRAQEDDHPVRRLRPDRRAAVRVAPTIALFAAAAFVLQVFVQGAWGVIPAHLTELSPDEIRGFYPGVTYQLGNLLAALNLPLQTSLAESHSGRYALFVVMVPVFVAVIVLTALGKEARGIEFGRGSEADAVRSGRFERDGSGQWRRPLPAMDDLVRRPAPLREPPAVHGRLVRRAVADHDGADR